MHLLEEHQGHSTNEEMERRKRRKKASSQLRFELGSIVFLDAATCATDLNAKKKILYLLLVFLQLLFVHSGIVQSVFDPRVCVQEVQHQL